jgi:hypothetical protein
MEYGYINEDGFLRSENLEPTITKYKDEETGEIKERIVSIEEQLEKMGDMWKPVDKIDESLLVSDTPEYSIFIAPYDNGDRISFRYEKMFNNLHIRELVEKLETDDYKIIKCYEAYLVGEELPYDIKELHERRQSIRNEINKLQVKQLNLKKDENI